MQYKGYKDVQLSTSNTPTAVREEVDLGDATDARRAAQVVQKAVNMARKTDVRHKKSMEDLSQCKNLWEEYQKQVREAFAKEHAQHKQDLAKLEEDVRKTSDAAEQAEVKLGQVLLEDGQSMAVEPTAVTTSPGESDPWDGLVNQTTRKRIRKWLATCRASSTRRQRQGLLHRKECARWSASRMDHGDGEAQSEGRQEGQRGRRAFPHDTAQASKQCMLERLPRSRTKQVMCGRLGLCPSQALHRPGAHSSKTTVSQWNSWGSWSR